VVAATSAATGVLMCRFDTVGACHALVRTLAVRIGLAAGGMAVLMFLLVAGLMKMMVEDEERREVSDEAASVWGEPW
jgi:hypothetical protein